MLVNYQGYLRFFALPDTPDTFFEFVSKCQGRELKPIERQDADFVWRFYRFANEYLYELPKRGV